MNAGLTNLDTLRKHLLAASLGAEPKFDAVITALGLGVAGLFDTFTNRKLAWSAAAEIKLTADREHFTLPRYPIADVTTVQMRRADADAWELLEEPEQTDSESGIIRFTGRLGMERDLVRVCWSGGYWFNTLEPDDENYPAEMPAGATALPEDLKAAFLMQCESAWQHRDALGAGLLDKPNDGAVRLATLDLVPLVKQILQGHIRYQLS